MDRHPDLAPSEAKNSCFLLVAIAGGHLTKRTRTALEKLQQRWRGGSGGVGFWALRSRIGSCASAYGGNELQGRPLSRCSALRQGLVARVSFGISAASPASFNLMPSKHLNFSSR